MEITLKELSNHALVEGIAAALSLDALGVPAICFAHPFVIEKCAEPQDDCTMEDVAEALRANGCSVEVMSLSLLGIDGPSN